MDGFLSLVALGLAGYFLVWKDLIEPLLRPRVVKTSAPRAAFKLRSRGSARSNSLNAGSGQQNAVQPPVNVQPNVQGSPAIAVPPGATEAPGGTLLITPNELQQLSEALVLRAKGATVEEAIGQGFGVKKGGSAGYKRAKELFDTATKAP